LNLTKKGGSGSFFVQFNTMAASAVCGAKLIAIPRRPVIKAARIANTLHTENNELKIYYVGSGSVMSYQILRLTIIRDHCYCI
jgi:hypothetical protein